MAGSSLESPTPNATAGQGTWRNLPERLLQRVLGFLGRRRRVQERRQSNSRQPNSRQTNSRSSTPKSKPKTHRNGTYRIERRSNWRTQRRKLMPFLSLEHKHERHDNCFGPHLIDAVRTYKLLDRLKNEQLESEQLALDLQAKMLDASIQIEGLKKIGNADFDYIGEEHEECIEDSEEALQKCQSNDKVRETSMRLVERDLKHSLQALFDTVDEHPVYSDPIYIKTDFVIALRNLKEALQRVTKAKQDHEQACAGRNSRKASKETPTEGQTHSDPRQAAVEAHAALQASRRLHQKLQEDFFTKYAVETAGDRADLPHFLTAENLDKLRAQMGRLVDDQVPLEADLPRQPYRDPDGRPQNNGTSLLPPLDDELQKAAAEFAVTKARWLSAAKHRKEAHDWGVKRWAAHLVARPTRTKGSIIDQLWWGDQPIMQALKELDDEWKQREEEHAVCRDKMLKVTNSTLWWEPDHPDYNPDISDYNSDSESPTIQAQRPYRGPPRIIRPWQRGVAPLYPADPSSLTAPSSSAPIKPFSQGSLQLPDKTSDIEKRQQRMQAYAKKLEGSRSKVEQHYQRYLEAEERRQEELRDFLS
ncbi:hypothetical protein PRZ48_002298 [Zasmidium cellare]|uniref:Uncharacterized protein n=1 Tax=Zasmidium cellare TaxID=395010 RepID=A0ABR0F4P2_ZASCE|nr:hypothetical protein PRZ48_002298 [Zasmidium cellare]